MRTYTDLQMILSGDCVSSISVLWSLCYVNTQGEKLFMFLYSGNIGTELSSTNLGMFITSDAGNSWRQVRTTQVYTLPVCLLWTEDVFMLKVCCQKWSKWVFLFFFPNEDFWWRVQHLVPWQWRGFAGSLTRSDTNSTPMVGVVALQQ